MEKYYSFAGLELAVDIPDPWMYTDERRLAPFRVDRVTAPHRFCFAMVENLTPPTGNLIAATEDFVVYADGDASMRYTGAFNGNWENAHIRTWNRGKRHDIQLKLGTYPQGANAKTVLNAMEAEHLVAQAGGVVIHSAYIDIGGRAILFTAPSGTGKSTQADLWHDLRGARIINGDRSVVRCTEAGVFACGIPFSGSSQYCENVDLPLAAIVYLQQAPKTAIRRLRGAAAFSRLWEGCNVNIWDRADVSMISETVTQVLSQVPVYELACTPDESAVLALEGVLKHE